MVSKEVSCEFLIQKLAKCCWTQSCLNNCAVVWLCEALFWAVGSSTYLQMAWKRHYKIFAANTKVGEFQ